MNCALCDFNHEDMKRFSDHIRTRHELSSEQYTIKVLYDGVRPLCNECGKATRYISLSFKKYCKEHARLAMSVAGKIGGKAEAWNRGKTKDDDERIAKQSAVVSGSRNHFFGKHHSQETIQKISTSKLLLSSSIEERLSARSSEFTLITDITEYRSRQTQYLKFKCVVCGEEQSKTLQAFERGSRCYVCYPVSKSNWELSVFQYIRSIAQDAISGDNNVISPKEIDVYVPSRKFGVECHGLYWHSEASRPGEIADKTRHSKKFHLAKDVGVRLLQLFEDEWRDKRKICESMIRHRLGLDTIRCKTWSTSIIQLDAATERLFFNNTHISGYTHSKICWGLRDRNGQLVAALSIRVPRHKTKYLSSMEVARFSTIADTSVPGGLSKLLKKAISWCAKNDYSSIMTYVDKRIGDGKGYISAGFIQIGETESDYWYTDNELRYDRFKFRAKDGKSEKEIAKESRMSKIWGCGSQIFTISCM